MTVITKGPTDRLRVCRLRQSISCKAQAESGRNGVVRRGILENSSNLAVLENSTVEPSDYAALSQVVK